MRSIIFFTFFMTLATGAGAQRLIPFLFRSDDDNRLIRENDSFKFYVASGDTSNMVAIDEESSLYRLYNHDHKIIAEGNFIAEGDKFLQDGKWTEYFGVGKVKRTGSYRRNMPVGTWEEYYLSGKLKLVCNYGIFDDQGDIASCLSGSFTEYYQNGKTKSTGFYAATVGTTNDTIMVADPTTGQELRKLVPHKKLTAAKTGHWEYFDENGELEKKEDL